MGVCAVHIRYPQAAQRKIGPSTPLLWICPELQPTAGQYRNSGSVLRRLRIESSSNRAKTSGEAYFWTSWWMINASQSLDGQAILFVSWVAIFWSSHSKKQSWHTSGMWLQDASCGKSWIGADTRHTAHSRTLIGVSLALSMLFQIQHVALFQLNLISFWDDLISWSVETELAVCGWVLHLTLSRGFVEVERRRITRRAGLCLAKRPL